MDDQIEQQVRQQKISEVIHREGLLDAIRRQLAGRAHRAGVVDEDVEPRMRPADLVGERADRRLRRHVAQEERRRPLGASPISARAASPFADRVRPS